MRFRWTIKELAEVSDHKLLETLITERQSTCTNVYSPMHKRLQALRANHDKLNAGTYIVAPELLKACKEAKAFILQLEREGKVDNPEVFHTLRQTITKAEDI